MRVSSEELKKILLDAKALTPEQIRTAEEVGRSSKESFDQILINKKLITERDLTRIYAQSINVPYVDLSEKKIPPDVLMRIPERIARKYQAILFGVEDGSLQLAMVDPEDFQAADFIEKQLGLRVKICMATSSDISNILEQYKGGLESEVTKAIKESGLTKDKGEIAPELEEEGEVETTEDAPISKTVNIILEYAKKSRASDIHIEPRESFVQVRYRVDGVLRDTMTLPRQILPAIVSRVKILANLKIDEHRIPQDGRFKINYANATIAIRVSTLPVMEGEKVVMRLLEESTRPLTLKELGFQGRDLEIIERNIHRPHGLTLVTGPTGAGKSTTLYSVLNILNTPEVNISTVEDPVEYKIPGVNQTQVNVKTGMTFANGLRALLRQDPNVIMVGEIRDTETADLAVQAALTGHVVLTTLHTNNAATTLPRLLDMSVEPFLIASTVNTVVGQRLVRKLCPHCHDAFIPDKDAVEQIKADFGLESVEKYLKNSKPPDEKTEIAEAKTQGRVIESRSIEDIEKDTLKEKIESNPHIKVKASPVNQVEAIPETKKKYSGAFNLYRPKGCSKCDNNGYLGRIGIYEVLEVTEDIGRMILEHASSEEIQNQAIKEGMTTMQQDGFLKALQGLTTLEEILRVTKE